MHHASLAARPLTLAILATCYGAFCPGAFGDGGIITTSITGGNDSASCVAVAPNGDLLSAGGAGDGGMGFVRLDTDGSLLHTASIDFGGIGSNAASVLAQPDNKAVLGGAKWTYKATYSSTFALARLNSSGQLDRSFGTRGKVTTSFGKGDSAIYGMALQLDGKIVAVGHFNQAIALARYNANGSLDSSFGSGGKVVTNPTPWGGEGAYAVAIQSDGKIVVTGILSEDGPGGYDIAVLRYYSNGSLDNSFGSGGIVTLDLSVHDAGLAVAIQGDGKIVVTGSHFRNPDGDSDINVIRFNSDGTLDSTFNGSGLVDLNFSGGDYPHDIALLGDGTGRMVVGAGGDFPETAPTLIQLNEDGSLDPSFGTAGVVISNPVLVSMSGMARQAADGKLVMSGTVGGDFLLMRFLPDGTLDSGF